MAREQKQSATDDIVCDAGHNTEDRGPSRLHRWHATDLHRDCSKVSAYRIQSANYSETVTSTSSSCLSVHPWRKLIHRRRIRCTIFI